MGGAKVALTGVKGGGVMFKPSGKSARGTLRETRSTEKKGRSLSLMVGVCIGKRIQARFLVEGEGEGL